MRFVFFLRDIRCVIRQTRSPLRKAQNYIFARNTKQGFILMKNNYESDDLLQTTILNQVYILAS